MYREYFSAKFIIITLLVYVNVVFMMFLVECYDHIQMNETIDQAQGFAFLKSSFIRGFGTVLAYPLMVFISQVKVNKK
jgi:hypothetical protein